METERIYYHQQDVTEFTATVVGVVEAAGKRSIQLNRTAFYPTSGGQPYDTGQLGEAKVIGVEDDTGAILHHVEGCSFEVGQAVAGRIDSERRRDHTQQHSAQHVLSAAFDRIGSFPTVSFHLGSDYSTIDLGVETVTPGQLADAERLAQSVVLEDRPVLIHFVDDGDVARFGLRKATNRTGTIRIVEIDDFDRSACGGTHVRRTGEIGPIKIRRTERRGTTTRVEFLAGWRALADYGNRLISTRAIADRLSVGDADLENAVQKLELDLAAARAEVAELREERLTREADELAAAASALDRDRRFKLVRKTYSNRLPAVLRQLAIRLVARGSLVALLGSNGSSTSLVFAQSDRMPFDINLILRQVVGTIGGRGGGTRNLAQGGGSGSGSAELAIDAAEQLLRAHCTDLSNVP